MAGISSLGVGSGLELGNLVDNLIQIERQTAEGPLNRRQIKAELRLSAIGGLRSSVSNLIAAATSLTSFEVGRSATSSREGIFNATAQADADTGTYTLNVQQLASAQSLATASGTPFVDADAALGEGSLSITVGSESVQLDIAEGGNSLRNIRDAINAADINVKAVVVQDGSNFRLLLTSGTTGVDGQVSVTVDGTLDTRLASDNMDETAAAQDAQYSVNGLSLTSSSNTIEGVIPGVSLDLLATTDGQPVTLTVKSNQGDVASRLDAFVQTYNALAAEMLALGQASPDGSASGPLVGDSSLRSLQQRVGSAFFNRLSVDSLQNPFSRMLDIGLTTGEGGRAKLDPAALNGALESGEGNVQELISSFGESFVETLKAFEGTDGILKFRNEQLSSELERIADQRADLARRMEIVEARLVSKFSALDAMVAQFNNTSTFLTQQLASLASLSKNRRS